MVLPLIFDHSEFLCSDSNVIEAYNNPTGYCQAQGIYMYTHTHTHLHVIAT